jgi:hypothetical protein
LDAEDVGGVTGGKGRPHRDGPGRDDQVVEALLVATGSDGRRQVTAAVAVTSPD